MSERPKTSITLKNPHSNEQLNKGYTTSFIYTDFFWYSYQEMKASGNDAYSASMGFNALR